MLRLRFVGVKLQKRRKRVVLAYALLDVDGRYVESVHKLNPEYFVLKAEFINLDSAAEIIPISEKICFIYFSFQ